MFRSLLGGCGQAQDLGVAVTVVWYDIRDHRLATGEGAGFIQNDRIQFMGGFQTGAVLKQYAVFRAFTRADHDRGWGGKSEGTWAGDDQHRDKIEQREGENRRRAEQDPDEKGQHRES